MEKYKYYKMKTTHDIQYYRVYSEMDINTPESFRKSKLVQFDEIYIHKDFNKNVDISFESKSLTDPETFGFPRYEEISEEEWNNMYEKAMSIREFINETLEEEIDSNND